MYHIRVCEFLTKCNVSGIGFIFIKILLTWSGHLSRMNDIRIPKQLPFGQFPKKVNRKASFTLQNQTKIQFEAMLRPLFTLGKQDITKEDLQPTNANLSKGINFVQTPRRETPSCYCAFATPNKAGLPSIKEKCVVNDSKVLESLVLNLFNLTKGLHDTIRPQETQTSP